MSVRTREVGVGGMVYLPCAPAPMPAQDDAIRKLFTLKLHQAQLRTEIERERARQEADSREMQRSSTSRRSTASRRRAPENPDRDDLGRIFDPSLRRGYSISITHGRPHTLPQVAVSQGEADGEEGQQVAVDLRELQELLSRERQLVKTLLLLHAAKKVGSGGTVVPPQASRLDVSVEAGPFLSDEDGSDLIEVKHGHEYRDGREHRDTPAGREKACSPSHRVPQEEEHGDKVSGGETSSDCHRVSEEADHGDQVLSCQHAHGNAPGEVPEQRGGIKTPETILAKLTMERDGLRNRLQILQTQTDNVTNELGAKLEAVRTSHEKVKALKVELAAMEQGMSQKNVPQISLRAKTGKTCNFA